MGDPLEELTPRQRLWLEHYLVSLNATDAARQAGYSETSAKQIGHENLTKPYLADIVSQALAEQLAGIKVTPDYVLHRTVETVEKCREGTRVYRHGKPVEVETEDGTMAAAFEFNAAGALKGLELLGRHLKMFPTSGQLALTDPNGDPLGTGLMDRLDIARRIAFALRNPEEVGITFDQEGQAA